LVQIAIIAGDQMPAGGDPAQGLALNPVSVLRGDQPGEGQQVEKTVRGQVAERP
jgi:hypothetical protein